MQRVRYEVGERAVALCPWGGPLSPPTVLQHWEGAGLSRAGCEVSNPGLSLLACEQHGLGAGRFVPSENTRMYAGCVSKLWWSREA